MIDLTIKTLDSQNHKFRVPDTFTILELKEHIAEQVNVTVVQQRLIFCGRVLSNDTKLADIGIDGKVMHLVQKVPRLATTTSGPSSSTTTNTNSRSGQNSGPGFRGWHTHDPTVLFGAIGIPSEFMNAGELPRLISARNHGTGNRVSLALDMIRKGNETLNRLENQHSTGRPSATDVEQFPEGPQQTEDTSENVLPESSASQTQQDPDSVNVSYEVDETFPNTVVVTIDATHHMRMPPGLIRQMHNRLQANNSHSSTSSTEQTVDSEVTSVPETTTVGSNNPSSAEQAAGTTNSEQNLRNDRQTQENRSSAAINDRRRFKELIEELNKLNSRLQPFYAQYCQYINEDPQFESIEGENGSHRAQTIFDGVSEVMHYISHVYHAISDLRIAFNRPPPRSFQSRPCLLQGTILHTGHHALASLPPPPTHLPTSTQTTTTSQSIPSVRAFRLDFLNPERSGGNDTPNVSPPEPRVETIPNMTADPNTESNNISIQFPSETPNGVELMLDLAPGTIRIDSVQTSFVSPNASGSNQPTAVSQPSSVSEPSSNMSMPIDWMDQMIDVISSGVRRPFMSDQSLDWNSIPTTSTRTPRVTPRTTDSSSTTNPPSQGLGRGRGDTPRMDPFLPCSSHHFESNLRPLVLARRSTQGMDRSTSYTNSGSSNTDNSTSNSPIETRSYSARRPSRPRTRYVPDTEGFMSGIHPVVASWGRTYRNNPPTLSASNNAHGQGNGSMGTLTRLIREAGLERETGLEREAGSERSVPFAFQQSVDDLENISDLSIRIPPSSSGLDLESTTVTVPRSTTRESDDLLHTPIGNLPYFRGIEGRFILVDLFLLFARNWTLHDMLNLNNLDPESSLVQNPLHRNVDALVNFILDRIMDNQAPTNHNIEEAANRIYLEMMSYINIFRCSVPIRTNIDVNATFRQCIVKNLQEIVVYCAENRSRASDGLMSPLTLFVQGFLSLVMYCCNTRSVFRLSIGALVDFLPLPFNLRRLVMNEVRMNIDKYWDTIVDVQTTLSMVDYIVPIDNNEFDVGQTSRVGIEEQSSNPTLPSPEITNEPLPEVVIGSQEWHHGVPSEWVPVIARDSQRQRRQGTQPPYSDAYLSGMPNKRRKIVTSSKPQGPLSQIIAKNLEVAMGAAGVAIKKEVTASVGADAAVQNAYSERIRMFGRSGLDTHPDFCPDRYPNASKFFYNHNHQN